MEELPQTISQIEDHNHNGINSRRLSLEDMDGKIDLTTQSEGTISLTTQVTGTLPIANGGTGQTSATAAFDALAPTTTQGDIIYHDGSDNVRLAKGTAFQRLEMNSNATALQWGSSVPAYQRVYLDFQYALASSLVLQVCSDSTGDNVYAAVINESGADTINIYRYQKDSITGLYSYKGSPLQLTGSDVNIAVGRLGIVAGDTYVWVINQNTAGTNVSIKRYAKDLTGLQNMTISGSTETVFGPALGNDSVLYIQSGGSTQWKSYSISGTTATNTGNVSRSDSDPSITGGFYDGTSLYVVDYNTSFNPVKEYNISGTLLTSTLTGYFESGTTINDMGAAVGIGYGGSGRLYIYSITTAHATASRFFLEMFLITKP